MVEVCKEVGITFFTSPYSISLVDYIDPFVPAHKIGSGDITWREIICHIALKNKPYMIATGASSLEEVVASVEAGLEINKDLILMQCNTNYSGDLESFKYVNLNVLKEYQKLFPNVILGLSDHTPGHAAVLGAVALGARVVEKHFTDDNSRNGPDHKFAMTPKTWKTMVERTRELEDALGDGIKRVEQNESETVVVQRRAIRLTKDLPVGSVLGAADLCVLRPCPSDAVPPYCVSEVIGRKLKRNKTAGDYIKVSDVD